MALDFIRAWFNISPGGELVNIDVENDYQASNPIGTRHQATHINSVCSYDDKHVLATLFHQDQLVKINKVSGEYSVVYADLINPHGVHRTKEGFVVSDTRGNRVVLLDHNLRFVNDIQGYFDWVQDAIQFNTGIVVANDNRGRFDFFDSSHTLTKQISWDTDQRMISTIYAVTAGAAKHIFLDS